VKTGLTPAGGQNKRRGESWVFRVAGGGKGADCPRLHGLRSGAVRESGAGEIKKERFTSYGGGVRKRTGEYGLTWGGSHAVPKELLT